MLRVVVGVVLLVWGLSLGGIGGYALAIVALVPLLAGALDRCVLTGIVDGMWKGSSVRSVGRSRT